MNIVAVVDRKSGSPNRQPSRCRWPIRHTCNWPLFKCGDIINTPWPARWWLSKNTTPAQGFGPWVAPIREAVIDRLICTFILVVRKLRRFSLCPMIWLFKSICFVSILFYMHFHNFPIHMPTLFLCFSLLPPVQVRWTGLVGAWLLRKHTFQRKVTRKKRWPGFWHATIISQGINFWAIIIQQ